MRAAAHLQLLITAVAVWAAFWVLGLPDYYQQYSFIPLAIGSTLLVPPIAWLGLRSIRRGRPEHRLARAAWMSVYFTVPFALLDTIYCGLYLGHGSAFIVRYWYLSIFYVIPWVLWMPMGWRYSRQAGEPGV